MTTIRSSRQAADVLRGIRTSRGLTRRQLAARIHTSDRTIESRETGKYKGYTTDALVQTADALGFDVALLPQPRPGVRRTGTGWPA